MVRVSVTLQGDGERRINASSQMGGKRRSALPSVPSVSISSLMGGKRGD